jgi:hypothetical protein
LTEFLILDVYEEVDYNFGRINNNNNNENKKKRNRKKKKNKKNKKDESDEEDDKNNDNQNEESSVGGSSLMSQSTNYGKGIKDEENNLNEEREHIMKCRKTFIKCIRNNKEKDTGEILEFKSYLADKIKAGEIYLGYDLNVLNLDSDNTAFLDANRNKLPDVILVRKKPNNIEIKGKKLKRLKFSNGNKKNKKKMDEDVEKDDMKAFMEEIYEENDLKNNLVNENDDNDNDNNNEKEEDINTNENGGKKLKQEEDDKKAEK